MKVLLLADSLPNGGLERQLTLVGRYLPREWERRVWSLAGGAYVDVLRQAGIEVHVDDRRSDVDVSPAFRLWRLVRSWRPDVVHAWGWMSSTAVAPVCLTAGIPLVDGSIRRAQRTRSRFHPLNTGLHLARLVVANSYAGLRAYDIPPRRGRVVYNGFDPDRFRFSEARPRSDDRVAVVMTGRMVPQKDYATFLAAARYLVAADSRAWQFVAVGEGPGREPLIAENQDLVDAQVASFPHGGLEVMGVLSGCHIGVLMTNPELHAEGCSNSILEYMACALPVVCGDSGGNRELVGDGKTGFIVPAREPRILAQRLLELRDRPELRRRMGDAGKAALMERFSVDRMIADLVRVYEEAVRKHAGGSTTAPAGRAASGG
jgi:glycosyltransferase involved in cell wall biosynthesis